MKKLEIPGETEGRNQTIDGFADRKSPITKKSKISCALNGIGFTDHSKHFEAQKSLLGVQEISFGSESLQDFCEDQIRRDKFLSSQICK